MDKLKLVSLLFISIILFGILDVSAQEKNKIFVNNKGVEVTEKELNFINEFYGINYFENMSIEDYEWIKDLNINNRNIELKSIYLYEPKLFTNHKVSARDTTHKTASKKLSIARSCDSNCLVITQLTWLVNPIIKSYDLIGARFSNTSLSENTITTLIKSNNGTSYSYDTRLNNNGFGTTLKLPTSSNIIVQQKFYTNLGGNIFASYQHATKNISIDTSYKYTIRGDGYGKVFSFYGNAVGVYDGMAGVDI